MSVKNYSDKKLLEQLFNVLDENMEKGKADIKTLATQLGISTCQLNRRIKEATGQTTSDYVMGIRIEKAKRMLSQFPEITIYDIALQCGFADTSHFSHVFRRKEGISPKQYILLQPSRPPQKE
jgi:AraC-like DNA-binding protein